MQVEHRRHTTVASYTPVSPVQNIQDVLPLDLLKRALINAHTGRLKLFLVSRSN